MVKANRGHIAQALKSLPPNIRGVLVYGRDNGLVRERAQALAVQVAEDPADPFRAAAVTPEQIKSDPARLADELAALSMTGGRRLVRVDGATDAIADAAATGLRAVHADAVLLVTAGDLAARSRLRKLFEGDQALLAIACYPDEARDLEDLVREVLDSAGLRPSADAVAFLGDHLGSDRQVSRRELEKLVLYKADAKDRTVTIEDVRAVVGDAAAMTVANIAQAVTGGERDGVDRLLDKAYIAGDSPVAILRVLARRLQQMHLARGYMAAGADAGQAADRLTPKLFFKERDLFVRHLRHWSADRLSLALERVMETEAQCKSTGMPAEILCARLCLQLAASVRR